MNSRQRFLETMRFGKPDRVPYFEEGIRKEVLQAWRKQGLAVQADLSLEGDRERLAQAALDRFGRIDVLVNNAGIGFKVAVEQETLDTFRDTMSIIIKHRTDLDLVAERIGTKLVAGASGERGGGSEA